MKLLRRTINPVIKVLDAKAGLVEYVASDETVDSYNEVVRANGARFDMFHKNAPFVDSHNYDTIEHLLGSVVDFGVKGSRVVETTKWAIDVPENKRAQLGFKMTETGHLKAVSIGFFPEAVVTAGSKDAFQKQLAELGLKQTDAPSRIYTQWQQVELSACILGANPNALARAYKAGVLNDEDLDFLSRDYSKCETANLADEPAASLATERAREEFLRKFEQLTKRV